MDMVNGYLLRLVNNMKVSFKTIKKMELASTNELMGLLIEVYLLKISLVQLDKSWEKAERSTSQDRYRRMVADWEQNGIVPIKYNLWGRQ